MFCKKCGKELDEGISFCQYCGAELKSSSVFTESTVTGDTATDGASTTVHPESVHTIANIKKPILRNVLVAGVAIFIGLVVICFAPILPPDVYVAGMDFDATSGSNVVTYWKNGKAVSLAYKGSAHSIYVTDSDVYVQGSTGEDTAVYWKNGKAVVLTDEEWLVLASSIYVAGSDVYVAGAVGFTAT
jgi:hypothetical protein